MPPPPAAVHPSDRAMADKKKKVVLACEVCGERNYKTQRPAGHDAKALTLKKFCPKCNKHTVHHESH